jgi:hypothetical protein
VADTAEIWPLPDFSSLLTGCYDICDNDTIVIDAPPGYLQYTWVKDGTVIATGTPSTVVNLTISPTSPWPGGNAGSYYLKLMSYHGCEDSSATLNINLHPCDTCMLSVNVQTVYCVQDDATLPPSYNFVFGVTYGGGSSANFTMAATNGTVVVTAPGSMVLPPGLTDVTGSFTPAPGQTHFCFSFTLSNGVDFDCIWDTCILLPPCSPPPCEFQPELEVDCAGVDANGNPIYNFSMNYIAPTTGTVYISSAQGVLSTWGGYASPGFNNISGTFTDVPPPDGVICIDFYFFDGDQWCYSQVCKQLPQVPPCFEVPPCIDIDLYDRALSCYSVNALGQKMYALSLTMGTSGANTYTYYVISNNGVVGSMAPALITNTPASYTGIFVQVFSSPPGVPICFTVIATDTVTGKKCWLEVCINPEPCDDDYYRLVNSASVNLYPNPTSDLTIAEYVMNDEKGVNEIVLTDLQGRIVYSERLRDTKGKVSLKTAGLVPGMYFVSAKNNGREILVKKLIVQQ